MGKTRKPRRLLKKLSRPRGGDSRKRGSWQADRDLVSDAMKADSLHYEAVRIRSSGVSSHAKAIEYRY
jgi:hypothetical protein